jgi:hypothetical protein
MVLNKKKRKKPNQKFKKSCKRLGQIKVFKFKIMNKPNIVDSFAK